MTGAEQVSPDSLKEPQSLGDFYDTTFSRVYSYFFQRVGRVQAVAEDLTQETFLAAARALQKGTVPSNPIGWVLGIARNHLMDHYGSREREERHLSLAWQDERSRDLHLEADSLTRERSHAALETLPPAQKLVLIMHYLDNLPVTEVAAAIGRSVHATESLLARGRERFRRAYGEVEDE